MKRIKFIKDSGQYKKGDIAFVTPNEAHGFIDRGVAQITKDMTSTDITTKKRKKRGSDIT